MRAWTPAPRNLRTVRTCPAAGRARAQVQDRSSGRLRTERAGASRTICDRLVAGILSACSATRRARFDAAPFLRTVPSRAGVYRMLDRRQRVLYVGKARNLRRRLSSWLRGGARDAKGMALLSHTAAVEVTVTHTETEALLLENNLIKEHRPRYNIVLRDDKSYPWIHLADHSSFPRFVFHRGARRAAGTLLRTLLQRGRGCVRRLRSSTSCSGPAMHRCVLPQSLPPLPPVPDRSLQRAMRRAHRPRCVHRGRASCHDVPRRQERGDDRGAG